MAKDKKKSKHVKKISKNTPYNRLTDGDKANKSIPQSFEERLNKALGEVVQTKPITESELERLERLNGPL